MEDPLVKLIPCKVELINSETEETPKNIISIGSVKKWEQGYTGKGVIIAVLDTGCDMSHPDLSDRVIGGYNFTKEHNGDRSNFDDTNGHGTHVAGTIAASRNKKGLVGVAPDTKLLILKVLNKNGNGSIKELIKAIHYAINWRGPSEEKVRVISLSLGTKNNKEELYRAIQRAIENEIPVVVASGNDGDGNINTNEYRFPAAYKEVIQVGAIDSNDEIAYFSNTNDYVDLYAPGTNIKSTYLNSGFAILSGTSMAAPHVSGAVALLIEEYERKFKCFLGEAEIRKILMRHTNSLCLGERIKVNVLFLVKKNRLKRSEKL